MKKVMMIAAAAAVVMGGMTATAYAGAEGKCKACHSFKAGEHKMGPSLFGVVGRTAGTAEGFNYSDGFKAGVGGKVWDEAALRSWIENSPGMAPGTKMPKQNVTGAKADQVIEFLNGLK